MAKTILYCATAIYFLVLLTLGRSGNSTETEQTNVDEQTNIDEQTLDEEQDYAEEQNDAEEQTFAEEETYDQGQTNGEEQNYADEQTQAVDTSYSSGTTPWVYKDTVEDTSIRYPYQSSSTAFQDRCRREIKQFNQIPIKTGDEVQFMYNLDYKAASIQWKVTNVFKTPKELSSAEVAIFSKLLQEYKDEVNDNGMVSLLDSTMMGLDNQFMYQLGSFHNQYVSPHDDIAEVITSANLRNQLDTNVKIDTKYADYKKKILDETTAKEYDSARASIYDQRNEAISSAVGTKEYKDVLKADLDSRSDKMRSFVNKALGKKRILSDPMPMEILDQIEETNVQGEELGFSKEIDEIEQNFDELKADLISMQSEIQSQGSDRIKQLANDIMDPIIPNTLQDATEMADSTQSQLMDRVYEYADEMQPMVDENDQEIFEKLDELSQFLDRETRQFYRIEQLYNATLSQSEKDMKLQQIIIKTSDSLLKLPANGFEKGLTYRLEAIGKDKTGTYAVNQLFYFQRDTSLPLQISKSIFSISVNSFPAEFTSGMDIELCLQDGYQLNVLYKLTYAPLMLLFADDCYKKEYKNFNADAEVKYNKTFMVNPTSSSKSLCTRIQAPSVTYEQMWYIRMEIDNTYQIEYVIVQPSSLRASGSNPLDNLVKNTRKNMMQSTEDARDEISADSEEYYIKKDMVKNLEELKKKMNLATILEYMMKNDLAAQSATKVCNETGSLYAAILAKDSMQMLMERLDSDMPTCQNNCNGQGKCQRSLVLSKGISVDQCVCDTDYSGEFCQLDQSKINKINSEAEKTLQTLKTLNLTSCDQKGKLFKVLSDITDQEGLKQSVHSDVASILTSNLEGKDSICSDQDSDMVLRVLSNQMKAGSTDKASLRKSLKSIYKSMTQLMKSQTTNRLIINQANLVGVVTMLSKRNNSVGELLIQVDSSLNNPATNIKLTLPKIRMPSAQEFTALNASFARVVMQQCTDTELSNCNGSPVLEVTLQDDDGNDIINPKFTKENITITLPIYDSSSKLANSKLEWWDEVNKKMSDVDCTLLSIKDGSADATCTHLTQFAVTTEIQVDTAAGPGATTDPNSAQSIVIVSMILIYAWL